MTDFERLAQRVDQLEGIVRGLYPLVQQLRADVGSLVAERATAANPPAAAVAGPTAIAADPPGQTRDAIGAMAEPAVAPTAQPRVAASPAEGRATTAPAASPRPAGPRTSAPDGAHLTLEAAVGRYGTLALATVSILLGVGAFVRWAIAHGWLGPAVRVALGLLAAGAVAAIGMRLRSHGARRFGHTLLALALAIVHVDAWGAGPMLHLVSSPVALGGAAMASAALAWLALVDGEPTTFSVGVGGALLAPFVTSTGEPHVVAVLTFGYAVIAISVWAVRDRGWEIPVAILALGSVVYTAVTARVSQPDWTAPAAFLPATFALGCASTAMFVLPPRYRSTLAQGALVALWNALAILTARGSLASVVTGAAAVGTIVAYATVPRLGDAALRMVVGAFILPLALLCTAVWAVPAIPIDRALVTAGWGAGAAVAATMYDRLLSGATTSSTDWSLLTGRSFAIAMAGLEGGAAIVIGFGERHPVLSTVLLAMYSAALAVVAAQRAWPAVLVPMFVGLAVTSLWSWQLLAARAEYAYTPFLTRPSLAAAASVAGWVVAAIAIRRAPRGRPARPGVAETDLTAALGLLTVVPPVLLFLWVRQELAGAVSSEVSTFLLIAYYAVAGVGAVFFGRARTMPPVRHAGLAVAVYAALKAVAEASHLGIGLRVSSYLLAGAFLLAVAYWYRAA